MDNTYRIRMIVAVAVASMVLTIAVAGVVTASPPVPAPNETSLIETSTDVVVAGSYYEEEAFDWTYSNQNLSDNNLTNDERVAQIRYDEHTGASDGYTEFHKTFKADGQSIPNLKVDKKIGFSANTNMATSGLDSTENVGMTIVSEGDTGGGTGVGALCVWARSACIPPTNEMIAGGSQLKDVKVVNSHTISTVATTSSPTLHHEITAKGPMAEGLNETFGVGTVAAGMKVGAMEGANCSASHPLASRLTYSELSRATGKWQFVKSMTYTAQIPAISIPHQYPIFSW